MIANRNTLTREECFRLLENKISKTNFEDRAEAKNYFEFAELLKSKMEEEKDGNKKD